ncbi:MAG: phenylalanine--tRNA ligase subunit beta, partial [Candidatus Omnitrophota bacterium]
AKKGEGIMTIDNVQRTLDSNTLVIADLNKPVAIAGIMGGKATEVSEETKNVLLEAAVFDPIIIRKACRQLSLASESSYRFERGIDQGMVLSASVRAQQLIREIAGGRTAGAITDTGVRPAREKELSLEIKEVKRVLGVEIDVETIKEIFRALDFSPLRKKDKMYLKIPSYRSDIDRDVDLIEEIARLYGYEKIPVKEPLFTPHKAYHLEKKTDSLEREVRHVLCSLGLNEIVTYSLASRSAVESLGIAADSLVRLQNPLSSEQEFMRPSLLSEMLEVVSWNLNRKNALLELFELNKVYIKGSDPAIQQEKLNLSIGMCGNTSGNWKNKAQEIDFFDLKGVVETLLASLGVKGHSFEKAQSPLFKDAMSMNIIVNGKVFGVMGETRQETARKFDIKKRVYMSEIFIEDLLGLVNLKKTFTSIPRYPAVKRDIALLVDDAVPASGIYNLIKEEARGMARSIEVFDLYKGQQVAEGKKSLAYSIEYRSDEKTLKDEEVNEAHKKVQDALIKKLGAQLR